ncbi:MAG: ATP-dependent DNA helicase RecQ [Proteobacteria bacterium CG1_02_64_396]|nr:MAG: ATP-dependent DNA helicase RecQ [Proteobacteria bacterium CG1_02_64_396]
MSATPPIDIAATLAPALKILHSVFGYESFRPPQDEVIAHLIQGGDALVLVPTGGGKSLCYQIPAMVRSGVGIVVSPLIALMQDQVAALRQAGVKSAFLNSTLGGQESWAVEQALLAGDLDLLYVAPERLMTPRFLSLLEQAPIALFAIDEAHCVSQWGHDFRPEYMQLSILHERFPAIPRIALTATADEPTRKEIAQRLGLESAAAFVRGFDRPNIRYRITPKDNGREQLLRFIRAEHEGDAGIVYCLSRKKVEETAQWLTDKGLKALPYHAGLPADMRAHHQNRFLREEGVIVVATIAFGMGIDKPNVRFVAHLDLPKSLESYYQETGRAGRDGLPASAWMAYGLQDVVTLKQMIESSDSGEERKRVERHKLEAMLGLCEVTSCRRQALLAYFGDRMADKCGNCDTCLEPVATWDGTEVAQKGLSAVYRTGQRFGASHVIDVLRGKETTKMKEFGHQQLTTFGIGKDLDEAQWRSVFRQLVARGFLAVDIEGYGAFKLTHAARPLLKGEQRIQLRRDPPKTSRSGKDRPSTRKHRFIDLADELLWDELRAKRKALAEEQGIPPYVIFHDATLMEMVEAKPHTLDEMSEITGIGERKLELYGRAFLQVILGAQG